MNGKALITAAGITVLLAALVACGGGGGGGNVTSVCQQASGVAYVGLAQQGGTAIYNAEAADPLVLCKTPHAVISKVTNDSGYTLSLAHGGPGSPFIILNSGVSITTFNGQPLEGNWSAQYSGDMNKAPSQMTIKVEWSKP